MRDDARTLTLADVRVGERAVLTPSPVLDAHQAQRLVELGLRPGATVRVMMRTAGGGRVLGVDNLRIVLDRSTLRAIPVAPHQTIPGSLPAPGERPPTDERVTGQGAGRSSTRGTGRVARRGGSATAPGATRRSLRLLRRPVVLTVLSGKPLGDGTD